MSVQVFSDTSAGRLAGATLLRAQRRLGATIQGCGSFSSGMIHSGRGVMRKIAIAFVPALVAWQVFASGLQAQEPTSGSADENTVAGWFRLDLDRHGIQPWVGAAYALGESADLTADVYLRDTSGRFDLGLAFYFGPLSINPAAGLVFDFHPDILRPTALVIPQLFTILEIGPVYFESWIQIFFQDMWAKDYAPARDYFYTRNFLLIIISRQVAIGPQVEVDTTFNNSGGDLLASLPFGGRINLGFGEANVLGLFLAYEFEDTAKGPDAGGLTGRFTFQRYW